MNKRLKILIVEPSPIIRKGIVAVLNALSSFSLAIEEDGTASDLQAIVERKKIQVLIVNPTYIGLIDVPKLRIKTNKESLLVVALLVGLIDEQVLKSYDAVISLYDSIATIQDKFETLLSNETKKDKIQLSAREQEIVGLIAQGLSNKQIADKLFVSTHTVTTHRRNIMNKLEIHSSVGITIYAIANNIVDITQIEGL